MYEGYSELRPSIFALADRLNQLGVTLTPCHNDLVAENFVKGLDGKIHLIDWEYSGMNDPLWDLAALFIESSFQKRICRGLYYCIMIIIFPLCSTENFDISNFDGYSLGYLDSD